jgi:hypothetical protein
MMQVRLKQIAEERGRTRPKSEKSSLRNAQNNGDCISSIVHSSEYNKLIDPHIDTAIPNQHAVKKSHNTKHNNVAKNTSIDGNKVHLEYDAL